MVQDDDRPMLGRQPSEGSFEGVPISELGRPVGGCRLDPIALAQGGSMTQLAALAKRSICARARFG